MSARVLPVPESMQAEMRGVSWRDDPRCPPFTALRLVRPRFCDLSGATRVGELIVAAAVAEAIAGVFAALYERGFPIASIARIEAYGGDDGASMAANNSSGFNFRVIDGTSALSMHALGLAVDINPLWNPWVRGDRIEPAAGARFVDRATAHPGMIKRPGPVTAAFDGIGWVWGGDWPDLQDYHHFATRR